MQRREGVGLYRAYLGRVSGVANWYVLGGSRFVQTV
jgi:hypothetical protein